MAIEIPLFNRKGLIVAVSKIDDSDAPVVGALRFILSSEGYARARLGGHRKLPGRHAYLHRLILGLSYGDKSQVDHINRDKLDNRRENLRIANHSENGQNVFGLPKKNSSGYRGVCWDKIHGRWRASVKLNGKIVFCRSYRTKEMAAKAAAGARAIFHPFSKEAADVKKQLETKT